MEENILKTIEIIQYRRKVDQHIRYLENNRVEPPDEDLSDLPTMIEVLKQRDKRVWKYPLCYWENKESAFTLGDTVILPNLSADVTKDILYKSVAALLAHAGYDTGMESAIQTLTDVAEDYFGRFTRALRVAVDREELIGNTGFSDVMERVFHEMRIGSVVEMHCYYQENVLNYKERMKDECLERIAALDILKQQQANETPDDQLMEEEMVDEEDIPEIHFPAMGDGDGVDELQPSLEPGFQMLHSLEQEVQLLLNV